MSAFEYIEREWCLIDRHMAACDRRAHWERIVEACKRTYGHDETSRAIVDHVLKPAKAA